jgi:hypothetical protein
MAVIHDYRLDESAIFRANLKLFLTVDTLEFGILGHREAKASSRFPAPVRDS